jgi:hypothetical protein
MTLVGPVPDRVAVLVQLVLGEEDSELDFAGAGAAVFALAFAAGRFPAGHGDAGAVDDRVELVRQRRGRQRNELPGRDKRSPLPDGRGLGSAAGLGGPFDALDRQPDPGEVFQQACGLRERDCGGGPVDHRGQPRRQGGARGAQFGIAGSQAVPAPGAVIPGPRERDRAEHGVDDLIQVGDEHGLPAAAAGNPRAAVAGIGGQQLSQHAAAQLHALGRPQPRARVVPVRAPGGTTAARALRLPAPRSPVLDRSHLGRHGATVPRAGYDPVAAGAER